MAEDHIRYDILAQEALRGVMRKVLAEVARTGLPGSHHFFITFLTGAPGVRISSRLRERYPEQMTIVVQVQFWDLKVTETGFEIGLSFSDIPEKLEVPFSAVRGFYDPSVNFELEFDVKTEAADGADEPAAATPEKPKPVVVGKTPEPKAETDTPAKETSADGAAVKGADKAFREAIAIDPKYAPAWRDLGELYESYDQQDAAAAIYEKGTEHADELVDLYNNLGMLKMEAQQPKEALVLFDKAVQQGANRTDVIFNLAFAFVANNDTRSAFRYLGEYIFRAGASDAENVKVAHMLRNAMLEELEKEKAKKEDTP